jgi:hypothetical protein
MISENLSGKQKTGKKNRFSHTSPLVRNSDWLWDRGLPLWPRNKMSNLQSKRPVFQKLRSMWILKPCWCDFWYESNYPLGVFFPPKQSQPNLLSSSFRTFMAAHLMKKTKSLAAQARYASWQCAFPHISAGKVMFHWRTNTSIGTSIVFAWFSPVWLFHIPKIKNLLESISFWVTWRHLKQCDNTVERTLEELFMVIFLGMRGTLEYTLKVTTLAEVQWHYTFLQIQSHYLIVRPHITFIVWKALLNQDSLTQLYNHLSL